MSDPPCLILSGGASTPCVLASSCLRPQFRPTISFHYHQEEAVGDIGYFRVRCTLIDGSELQLIERFREVANALAVEKYSFHWQRNDGTPICRWDNAPHHRDLATFPHHLHEGRTEVVRDHAPIDAFAVLDEIEKRLSSPRRKT